MTSLPSRFFKIRYGRPDDTLAEFYLPALERAVRYDLLIGFASSEALARATAGLQRLILRGGHVRLLCGARLSEDDTQAIRDGASVENVVTQALLRDLAPPESVPLRQRLEAVGWMLAHQHLTIRVKVPHGDDGNPLEENEARLFHQPEEAVIRDAEGHKLAWSGGPDAFWTFASYPRGKGNRRIAETASHVRAIARRLELLWDGEAPGWQVLDLPVDVRDVLLALCPAEAPARDPLEKTLPPRIVRAASNLAGPVDERLLLRFLKEAPYLPNARDLGVATSAVEPWPHQLRVVRRVTHRFPANFLFCDEVGLGKTIEAGLALRQLMVSGRVTRALLLVPKNVLRQWQEELYEKMALHVPRLEGTKLFDVFGHKIPIKKKRGRSKNPWNAAGVILASSHLARRRQRRDEILRADPWDLVIVDEAHHARRTDFRPGHYRPNKLLELLAGSGGRRGLKDRTRCLYLLTATPMQVHPVELWDLLRLLGLGGRWGALEEHFLRFFEQLRRPFRKRDWPFLAGMLADALQTVGGVDPAFRRSAIERLGTDGWSTLESLITAADPSDIEPGDIADALPPSGRQVLDELLRRHTPISAFVERNTRKLLRRYRMQGILRANVPERRPENVWIPFKDDEKALYERIEAYIVDFYRRYEAERRGLGFLMTVYRRRLTSSFHAIRRSLERRLAYLRGEDLRGEDPRGEKTAQDLGLFVEDFEQDDLESDLLENANDESHEHRRSEQAYLEDFLRGLGALSRDSKVERLFQDLEDLLRRRDTVLVFTQYTDTMDHLREELRPVYGEHLACYSGRGGEVCGGEVWQPRPKEQIKEAFRRGEIRVLLATEAASEGLNLQTCGILINFDMPWNPMRVEQRIGRLDRIGQTFGEVWIRNYFYEDSVEAVIYQRLADRIHWFEQVLGRLQPILHQVGEVIERVAMLQGTKRERGLEEHLTALGMQLDQPETSAEDFDPLDDSAESKTLDGELEAPTTTLETPVTLTDLEAALVTSDAFARRFTSHPSIAEAYLLRWNDEDRAVTFSTEVFDRFPNSVELITWGHPLFDELVGSAEAPAESEQPTGLGLYRTRSPEPLSLFVYPEGPRAVALTDPQQLSRALAKPAGKWTGSAEGAAVSLFSEARQRRLRVLQAAAAERLRAQERSLTEGARQVLRRAALVNLAMGQHASLFEDTLPYGFGPEAVAALRGRGAPFAALLDLVGGETIEAKSDDPYFLQIQGRSSEDLQRKSKALVTEGKEIAARHAILTGASPHPEPEQGTIFERLWFPLVESQEAAVDGPREPPFHILDPSRVEPFENAVPVYDDLESVAWRFAETPGVEEASQVVSGGRNRGRKRGRGAPVRLEDLLQADERQNPADYTWAEFNGRTVPQPGLFLVQVMGEAMNKRIPSGAWCLFRLVPQSTRDGQVVLARCEGLSDPETGGGAVLRIYESRAEAEEDGDWRLRIMLRPTSTDASFQPIKIDDPEDGGFRILAELVEVFL